MRTVLLAAVLLVGCASSKSHTNVTYTDPCAAVAANPNLGSAGWRKAVDLRSDQLGIDRDVNWRQFQDWISTNCPKYNPDIGR